ncbi:unnamed protein product, partial [Meganyctiphanes norvegica]
AETVVMGPEGRNRRFLALVILSALILLTSWIEKQLDEYEDAYPEAKNFRYNEQSSDHSGNHRQVGRRKQEEEDGEEQEEEERKIPPGYSRIVKSKSKLLLGGGPVVHLDIMACLPRFICEVHAQPPGEYMSELEKDILALFKSHVVLEGPGSPVYNYQVAAHMGKLSAGFDPSPCHGLFSACALSRVQLLEILKGVKTSRRMFL